MARLIPAAERISRARALIEKARALPNPAEPGQIDFAFVAEVKNILQQARDFVKFIPYSPSATPEMKQEVAEIFAETTRAEKEILHP